ncbi:MAG: antibiotic biosynthesis monooxygenase [Bacteroides sp.]|nr:antibiotic biosynthesis monooxygenase [Bacteroides sp.]
MITIVAKFTLKAGKKEEFIQAVTPIIESSRKESGNRSYNLFEDIQHDHILTFIEEWEDKAAIDFHNQTAHFLTGLSAIKELSEDIEITQYQKL